MLCPYAMELLWHGLTPLPQPNYPTADESKTIHTRLKDITDEAVRSAGSEVVTSFTEYEHEIGFRREDALLCARSKADLIYTIETLGRLVILYTEVSSSRINVAKPWQALLRGIALYYEWRLPIFITIISPEKIMYKLLIDQDQDNVLRKIHSKREGKTSPNLCSLCELAHFCPYRTL